MIRRILAALLALLVASTAASAAGDLAVQLLDTELETDGKTTLVVAVRGDEAEGTLLDASSFDVTEDGHPVRDLRLTPLVETEHTAISVLLVIDTSGSTAGPPLENAKAAAGAFAASVVERGIDVGLVAFGPEPAVVRPFTDDAGSISSGLTAIEARGETALYDAVLTASRELERRDGQRHLVIFSDGADTVSTASLEEAVGAIEGAEATASVVALETEDLDPAALQQLADASGGEVVAARNAAALGGAFDSVARSIASQYVLTYTSDVVDAGRRELDLAITVTVAGTSATQVATVTNPRHVPVADLPAVTVPEPTLLQHPATLWMGLGAAFVALLLVLAIASTSVADDAGSRTLRRSLRIYSTGASRGRDSSTASRLSTRAGEVVDRLPKPARLERSIQEDLDRAAWPLRASEFLAIQIALAGGGFLLGYALVGNPLFGLLLGGMAAAAARVVLTRRVAHRQADFLTQLPDTLGLLASSLKAGYGLVQAIDTVVKEAPEPTASEFARALTEVRLGRPLEESLDAMAERLGGEDFAWVVMAINVQNEVGGNLAELLTTVAATLRERVQVQRQIQVLSAEGRLSALVLIALPIVLAAYMAVVSPDYLGLLFGTFAGRLMVAGAVLFGIIGVFWMRRVVDIDV